MVGIVGASGGSFDYVQSTEPDAPLKGESWFDTDGGSDGNGEVKVYDGSTWQITGFTDHGDLTGVTESAHHNPVSVNDPLAEDGTQGLSMQIGDGLAIVTGALQAALGNALTFDADGNVAVPADGIDTAELAADAVTNAVLAADAVDSAQIANDAVTAARIAADAIQNQHIAADAVDSAQIAASAVGTGHLSFDTATQSELDSHAGDTTNPHNVTDDQTGAATALSNHAGDADAHHSRPTGTNSAGGSGTGRQSTFEHPHVTIDDPGDEAYNSWVPLGGRYDEIYIVNPSGFDYNFAIQYADGTKIDQLSSASSSVWVSTDPAKVVVGVSTEGTNVSVGGVNPVAESSHSHSI